MDFRELKKELDKDEARLPLYIFTGEEREIMKKYIKRIDPEAREAESFQSLRVRFQNVGLFKRGKRETFYIYNDKSVLETTLGELTDSIGNNCVILIYDSIDGRTSFSKSASIITFEFPKLDAHALARHVDSLIDETKDLPENVSLEICRLCNYEVARVESECDKLNRLDAKRITMDLVYEMIVKYPEDVIFDMIKAVAKRNPKVVYELLEDLKERKESPVKIVSLLYTQFRNILLVQSYSKLKNQEIADKTHLSSGQVYYIRELLGAFPLELLKDHLLRIQQAEVNIKTGKLDQQMALDKLLIEILR